MAAAAKAIGFEGIIIDGAVRDKETLSQSGFPIFSKGFIPNGPLKTGQVSYISLFLVEEYPSFQEI